MATIKECAKENLKIIGVAKVFGIVSVGLGKEKDFILLYLSLRRKEEHSKSSIQKQERFLQNFE